MSKSLSAMYKAIKLGNNREKGTVDGKTNFFSSLFENIRSFGI